MKKSRFTEEQMVAILREADKAPVPEVARKHKVIAQAIIETLDCTNNPGPHINVSGSMSVSPGVKARFIFRNQRTDGAPHEAIAMADVALFTNGFAFSFPKQPVQGGVGGNPWISVRFADASGQPISPGDPAGTLRAAAAGQLSPQ